MNRILALAVKDLRLLLRDKPGFFFVFFFPLIYAVFFGSIFSFRSGGIGSLKIAVVDEDQSEASSKFIQRLKDAKELEIELKGRREAEDLVRRGDKSAYVIIPSGFEESGNRIFQGEPIAFEVGLDPGRAAESGIIQGILTQHAFYVLRDLFTDRKAMREQIRSAMSGIDEEGEDVSPVTRGVLKTFLGALDTFLVTLPEEKEGEAAGGPMSKDWQPVKIDFHEVRREYTGPKTSYDITMPQAFIWVFLGCAAAFGISLVVERTRGTLLRLRSAPVSLAHILAGKAAACFITSIADLIVLFLFFYAVFGVRPTSYLLLALAMVCSAIAFVGVMMLVSVSGRTEASAGGFGWAFLLIMAMLGGGMVPYFFMPEFMKTLSHVSFVKWSILALEGAVWRDFSLREMLSPCAVLIAIGVLCFGAGVVIFKRTAE